MIKAVTREIDSVVIRFAGDSGDGMQLVGQQFTDTSALAGNDISTLPDFPAEIRAPQGTLPGVSGFQINFGSKKILTPGDDPEALVAMNPAALKVNIADLVSGGLLILNTAAFTEDNLKKAGFTDNPLNDPRLSEKYQVVRVDITNLTLEALKDNPIKPADKLKCKNFFAMGLIYWIYGRSMDYTLNWIQAKWSKYPDVRDANTRSLKAGYYYGETAEISLPQYRIDRAPVEPGIYRKINGNEGLVLGLIAGAECCWRKVLYAGYPITPASSILEGMAKNKSFYVKTIQAEDEISAIGMAIGASYAGCLGVTATSGPGICLKSEAMGLAVMTEIPLIIIDVQRGGPSTGLPTKTEQTDLLQVMFGRNGESPIPVLAASSPSDCFDIAIEAVRIAVFYRTPVIILSDNYIANSSEPWKIPDVDNLPNLVLEPLRDGEEYIPYKRDPETFSRRMVFPGRRGFEHRLGGLEKNEQGIVSYDPANHERMVHLRAAKVQAIAKSLPKTELIGSESGKVLIITWGGSSGAVIAATEELLRQGKSATALILRHLNPLPADLGAIMKRFEKVLIVEQNLGQLALLIRGKYLIDALSLNKVQGKPFKIAEVLEKVNSLL